MRTQHNVVERTPLLSATMGTMSSGISAQWSGAPELALRPTDSISLAGTNSIHPSFDMLVYVDDHGSPRQGSQKLGSSDAKGDGPEVS